MPIQVIPAPNVPDPMQQMGQMYELMTMMQQAPLKRQYLEAQIAAAGANQAESAAAAEASRAATEKTKVETGQEQFKLDAATSTRKNVQGALKSAVWRVAAGNPTLEAVAAKVPDTAASVEELPIELQDPVGTMIFMADPKNRAFIAENDAKIRNYDASAYQSRGAGALHFAQAKALAENPASDSKELAAKLDVLKEDRKGFQKSLADLRKEYLAKSATLATTIVGGPKAQEKAKAQLDASYLPRIDELSKTLDDNTSRLNEILNPTKNRLVSLGTIKEGPVEDEGGPEAAQKVNPTQIEGVIGNVRDRFLGGDKQGAINTLRVAGIPADVTLAAKWADDNLSFLPKSSKHRKILTQTIQRLAGLASDQLTLEGIRKASQPMMDVTGKGFAYPGKQLYESDIRGYLALPSEIYPETPTSPRVEAGISGYGAGSVQ